MPITENNSIEYSIPDHIKSMITPEFCAQFLKELHMIFGASVEDTGLDYFIHQGGTAGWVVAFSAACRKLGLDELYKYYAELPWYDSDVFDGEIEDILVEQKLVLGGFLCDEIARQNGISHHLIRCCDKCGKYYHRKDIMKTEIDLGLEGIDETYVELVCKTCAEKGDIPSLPFDTNRVISERLNKSPSDFFVCEKCGQTHYLAHRGENYCLHCEQTTTNGGPANDYYIIELMRQRAYQKKLFGNDKR